MKTYQEKTKTHCSLVTAHHADDQFETLMLRLLNGSDLNGLRSIRNKLIWNDCNGQFEVIRPLLPFTKSELLEYAKLNNIAYADDQSNYDTTYPRSKIRIELKPFITQIFGEKAIFNALKCFSEINQAAEIVEKYSEQVWDESLVSKEIDTVLLDYHKLKPYLVLMRKDCLRRAVHCLVPNARVSQQRLLTAIRYFSNNGEGIIQLGNGVTAQLANNVLKVTLHNSKNIDRFELRLNGEVCLSSSFSVASHLVARDEFIVPPAEGTLYLDFQKLSDKELYFRRLVHGDAFRPFGLKHDLKATEILRANKIPAHLRDCFVLCADGEIVALPPFRINDKYKVTKYTEKILKLVTNTSFNKNIES